MMAEMESEDCLLLTRSNLLVGAASSSLSSSMTVSAKLFPAWIPDTLGALSPGEGGLPPMNGSTSDAQGGSFVAPSQCPLVIVYSS